MNEKIGFIYPESQFAHTNSDQRYLLNSFIKEAIRQSSNEATLLHQLTKEPNLLSQISNQPELTILSSLNETQCKHILPEEVFFKKLLNPLQINHHESLFTLEQLIDNTQNLLILNPYIANILFFYPSTIKSLAKKIKGQLIFPFYIKKHPIQIEWDPTCRATENLNDEYWRWALNKEAHLFIINNSPNSHSLIFKATIQFINERPLAPFKIYFLNNALACDIENGRLEFKIDVPPGRHRLSIVDSDGCGIKQEGWAQTLYFSINNLMLHSEDEKINLNKQAAYNDLALLSLHDEQHIRDTLHASSFFEVNATAFSKESYSYAMPTTRFHYLDKHYLYSTPSKPHEKMEAENIWYFAKRTATLKDM